MVEMMAKVDNGLACDKIDGGKFSSLWPSQAKNEETKTIADRRWLSDEGYRLDLREVSCGGSWPIMALHGGAERGFPLARVGREELLARHNSSDGSEAGGG